MSSWHFESLRPPAAVCLLQDLLIVIAPETDRPWSRYRDPVGHEAGVFAIIQGSFEYVDIHIVYEYVYIQNYSTY